MPFDDVESIFYILIYFLNGCLPWEYGKNINETNKNELIIKIRETIPSSFLCKDFPKDFQELFNEIKNRKNCEKPNYEKIIGTFEKIKKDIKVIKDVQHNKFKWIEIFQEAINNNSRKISKLKKNEINNLFLKYGLKLKQFLDYINNK